MTDPRDAVVEAARVLVDSIPWFDSPEVRPIRDALRALDAGPPAPTFTASEMAHVEADRDRLAAELEKERARVESVRELATLWASGCVDMRACATFLRAALEDR